MSEMNKKPEYETNVVKPEIAFTEGNQNLRAIRMEDEQFLDTKLSEIDTFISNNHGLGKEEIEKDQ
jgi:hypothetical protein